MKVVRFLLLVGLAHALQLQPDQLQLSALVKQNPTETALSNPDDFQQMIDEIEQVAPEDLHHVVKEVDQDLNHVVKEIEEVPEDMHHVVKEVDKDLHHVVKEIEDVPESIAGISLDPRMCLHINSYGDFIFFHIVVDNILGAQHEAVQEIAILHPIKKLIYHVEDKLGMNYDVNCFDLMVYFAFEPVWRSDAIFCVPRFEIKFSFKHTYLSLSYHTGDDPKAVHPKICYVKGKSNHYEEFDVDNCHNGCCCEPHDKNCECEGNRRGNRFRQNLGVGETDGGDDEEDDYDSEEDVDRDEDWDEVYEEEEWEEEYYAPGYPGGHPGYTDPYYGDLQYRCQHHQYGYDRRLDYLCADLQNSRRNPKKNLRIGVPLPKVTSSAATPRQTSVGGQPGRGAPRVRPVRGDVHIKFLDPSNSTDDSSALQMAQYVVDQFEMGHTAGIVSNATTFG